LIKKSNKNIFAVVDDQNKFAGIIELNDIKQKLFSQSQYENLTLKSLMKRPPAVILKHENMHQVMEKFDITQSWYLPVLDENKLFLGFISKTKLFNKYREIIDVKDDLYASS
jgi:CIC family chloride channel protein